jgi:peptidoglycan hydrolase CwlO-like protein
MLVVYIILDNVKKFIGWFIQIFSGKTNYDRARLITIGLVLLLLIFLFFGIKSFFNNRSIRQQQKQEQRINANIENAQKNITILEVESNSLENERVNINNNINSIRENINKGNANIQIIKNRNKNVSGRDLDEKANKLY